MIAILSIHIIIDDKVVQNPSKYSKVIFDFVLVVSKKCYNIMYILRSKLALARGKKRGGRFNYLSLTTMTNKL